MFNVRCLLFGDFEFFKIDGLLKLWGVNDYKVLLLWGLNCRFCVFFFLSSFLRVWYFSYWFVKVK